MSLYREYLQALANPGSPVLFLDLEKFEKNISWVKENAGGKSIRIATKSIRSRDVLKRILDADEVFQGLMTFDLREALWLKKEGFEDILMGYPSVDHLAIEDLARAPEGITLMVDREEHLLMLEKIAAKSGNVLSLCVDVDLSMDLPGLRFGVYRSHINSLERMKSFVGTLKKCPHLKLTGLMGYEAQIAGVMDKESFLIRSLKKMSLRQLQRRRQELVSYLHQEGFVLKFVNGGGTGSLSDTREEQCVTEITVGSGFYSPVLFDHYQNFKLEPALAFTLPVVRHPEPGIFTCLGGGYIASGSLEKIKQPEPYLPEGMKLLTHEGAGEVQTPVHYTGPDKLTIGSSIIMRHAKAGEVCERFSHISLLRQGKCMGTALTYRGEGKTFV